MVDTRPIPELINVDVLDRSITFHINRLALPRVTIMTLGPVSFRVGR